VDANAAGLRELSGRAFRARLSNLVYVRSAVESLPDELTGVADRITVVLPWGSLLAAVARPVVEVLRGVRSLSRPSGRLEVVLAPHAVRDLEEWRRLGMDSFDPHGLAASLAPGYAEAGFQRVRVRALGPKEVGRWSSTWARRLAHAGDRSFVLIEARAGESVG
jgi:16S rRNA (adenine(1408)-N(1))-methyltransferase